MTHPMSRRSLLLFASTTAAMALLPRSGLAAPMPEVRAPRATSGDALFEPNWDERLTITVGPEKADIVGTTDRAVQAAVDYVVRLGGGTVHLQPGTYTLRNSVFLKNGVRLLGSGADSLLFKKDAPDKTIFSSGVF